MVSLKCLSLMYVVRSSCGAEQSVSYEFLDRSMGNIASGQLIGAVRGVTMVDIYIRLGK